ncbi:hypothetical protein IEQ34_010718 [Dendrobium chrysotoxum]|uniref:LOB domain-containing protein n=1 Tax=Dendrobium chrysotoxum TaxID=161865 RepID=A0AAV7GXU6_DENCH|nr:hypothetical protein IEQ34_010718 [Dendrobium chrysotoxum]
MRLDLSAMESVALKSFSSKQAVLPAPPTMASGGQAAVSTPCAGCKFLRRKCQADCIFAPYFPPDNPHKFVSVHRVFGASNVSKILNELSPDQREDAVTSLAFEADMRLQDPVNGCVGMISLLQRRIRQLQISLFSAQSELVKYQSVAEGIEMEQQQQQQHHHHQQQQQQKMMMMRGYAAEMGGSFARPSLAGGDDHHHNTLGAIS